MNSSSKSYEDIRELAESILESGLDRQETIEQVERYASMMDLAVEAKFAGANDEELTSLFELHSRVIELIESAAQGERGKLKELRQRQKGLRAYIDVFPKRVQAHRTRRG